MRCVWEHNGNDTLLYSVDYVGAYTRGHSLESAMAKMEAEIRAYSVWTGQNLRQKADIEIVQEKSSELRISDADSDILFDTERTPFSKEEYQELKAKTLIPTRSGLT